MSSFQYWSLSYKSEIVSGFYSEEKETLLFVKSFCRWALLVLVQGTQANRLHVLYIDGPETWIHFVHAKILFYAEVPQAYKGVLDSIEKPSYFFFLNQLFTR